jgi:hypothetical protein
MRFPKSSPWHRLVRPLLTGLFATSLFALVSLARAQAPAWMGYGRNAQHTAISPYASQPLTRIKWQAPVDLQPPYNGNDLFIHYGCPAITASNTVIFPVRTSSSDTYRIEGHRGSDGALLWQAATGYTLPPHDWTPSVGIVLTPTNRLYFPGVAGTVNYRNNPDVANSTMGSYVFYGKDKFYTNIPAYSSNVHICTPLTSDLNGNIYFGFYITGSTPIGLQSGLARITPTGVGTYIAATTAASDPNITHVAINCTPAISNDGKTVYVAVNTDGFAATGYLLGLDSTTLQTKYKVYLKNPVGDDAYILDDGTSSPTIGPDGDVYFGTWNGGETHERGYLLHFSSDLKTTKIAGAFGWDDSAAIVPATMVPSYHGKSTYLLMTKYNNYAEAGGDGVNRIAILDPNATEASPINGATVMKEIMTIAGPTKDTDFNPIQFPDAVREWCINTAAIDPINKTIVVNDEDGHAYRWSMVTNTLTESLKLTPGIGEAYTPTVIGPDGTAYAINNAVLFAIGN